MRIYLGGKIKAGCWRHSVVSGLRDSVISGDFGRHEETSISDWWPILDNSIFGEHDYVGPFFIACDHGCYHGENTHGSGIESYGCSVEGYSQESVSTLCLKAIDKADLVFCWIDTFDCFGTLTEIGYALGRGVPVFIATPEHFNEPDMWFPLVAADQRVSGLSVQDSLKNAIRWLEEISERSANDFINEKNLTYHDSKTERLFRMAAGMQDHFTKSRDESLLFLQRDVSKIILDAENISTGNASWRSLIDFAIMRPLKSALLASKMPGGNTK